MGEVLDQGGLARQGFTPHALLVDPVQTFLHFPIPVRPFHGQGKGLAKCPQKLLPLLAQDDRQPQPVARQDADHLIRHTEWNGQERLKAELVEELDPLPVSNFNFLPIHISKKCTTGILPETRQADRVPLHEEPPVKAFFWVHGKVDLFQG